MLWLETDPRAARRRAAQVPGLRHIVPLQVQLIAVILQGREVIGQLPLPSAQRQYRKRRALPKSYSS